MKLTGEKRKKKRNVFLFISYLVLRLRAGQRSSKQIAWMNFIAVSHSRSFSLLGWFLPFPRASLPRSLALPLAAWVFSALSSTHAPRHTSGEADRCNTVARREGGSLALNNTGTRTDLVMERSGWGWNQEREMWEWYDVSASAAIAIGERLSFFFFSHCLVLVVPATVHLHSLRSLYFLALW